MSKANKDVKEAKRASAPCAEYVADIKASKDDAMTVYFNTPELQAVRTEIEEAERLEEEFEKQLKDREYAIFTADPTQPAEASPASPPAPTPTPTPTPAPASPVMTPAPPSDPALPITSLSPAPTEPVIVLTPAEPSTNDGVKTDYYDYERELHHAVNYEKELNDLQQQYNQLEEKARDLEQ